MKIGSRRRPVGRGGVVAALALAIAALGPTTEEAGASGPPVVNAVWSSAVSSTSARLSAAIDPNGSITAYHFEYTTTDFTNCGTVANPACLRFPATDASLAASGGPPAVGVSVFNLAPATTYTYRVVAANGSGSAVVVPSSTFITRSASSESTLPDNRGWEMVSPIDKNGGRIDPPGAIAGGGTLQAASDGNSVTYGSTASFAGGQGAPPASQYLGTRGADGWATQNITAPIFSATYDSVDQGAPYQLFSPDLDRGLLLNGDHCRGGASGCAVDNPPLAGSGAPTGYQDYYLREGGAFTSLLTSTAVAALDLAPADFDLRFAGASPDLSHIVLASCAALTADANEIAAGSGCDPSKQNLYEWSADSGLAPTAINGGAPGSALAAQSGAVSNGGDRVYWNDTATGDLSLRDGTGNHLVGAASDFQTATADGATAFYTTASGDLHSYDAASHTSSATLASGVVGVLGISDSGDTFYFQDGAGLQRWHSGTVTQVAPGADAALPSDYPPATGTARISADGEQILFLSKARLTGYDNTDLVNGDPDSEVFLYDAGALPQLACLSCNPTNERPLGPSTIPGAVANGTAPGSTDSYKPRALFADGRGAFFDSGDSLDLTDTNTDHITGSGIEDVYEWEAAGEGSCAQAGGCLARISSGHSSEGTSFVDASADGSDAFFLTNESLVSTDPGSLDLYDARVGGGLPAPSPPIPCEGDACQSLPPEPIDPTLDTLLAGHGNPPVRYHQLNCRRGFAKHKGRCVLKHKKAHHKKHHGKKKHHKRRHRRGGWR